MKKLVLLFGVVLASAGTALTYHVFENVVHFGIDTIWYDWFNTDNVRWLVIPLALILSLSLLIFSTAFTSPPAQIVNDAVLLNFPKSATFQATITADSDIQSIVLEYGNEQQTCGEVIAKAFPQFTPGKSVNAEWTWEMRQSGSLPPGATLWWRWRVTDADGNETVSKRKTATWLDDAHDWQTLNNGDFLRLHWYEGDQTFAIDL